MTNWAIKGLLNLTGAELWPLRFVLVYAPLHTMHSVIPQRFPFPTQQVLGRQLEGKAQPRYKAQNCLHGNWKQGGMLPASVRFTAWSGKHRGVKCLSTTSRPAVAAWCMQMAPAPSELWVATLDGHMAVRTRPAGKGLLRSQGRGISIICFPCWQR